MLPVATPTVFPAAFHAAAHFLSAAVASFPTADAQYPALPQTFYRHFRIVMSGTSILVRAGATCNASNRQFGDTILLDAGATYSARYAAVKRTGSGWIVIRTSLRRLRRPGTLFFSCCPRSSTNSTGPRYRPLRELMIRFTGVNHEAALTKPGICCLADGPAANRWMFPTWFSIAFSMHGVLVGLRRELRLIALGRRHRLFHLKSASSRLDTQAIACGMSPYQDYVEGSEENVWSAGGSADRESVPSDIECATFK